MATLKRITSLVDAYSIPLMRPRSRALPAAVLEAQLRGVRANVERRHAEIAGAVDEDCFSKFTEDEIVDRVEAQVRKKASKRH